MNRVRKTAIWCAFGMAFAVPLAFAATSPLLQWRDAIYQIAGLAGVVALGLLLLQPLLAWGVLPGLEAYRGRRIHRVSGTVLVAAVIVHVIGLWITSPPDVVDALLFVSATSFSVWGVIAMWALFGAALLAVLRRRLRLQVWRLAHSSLVCVVVLGSVIHALLIDGTMERFSKWALCVAVIVTLVATLKNLKPWVKGARRPRA